MNATIYQGLTIEKNLKKEHLLELTQPTEFSVSTSLSIVSSHVHANDVLQQVVVNVC